MTTFVHTPVPPAGSPAWREIYPVPPDVRFEVGPFCPLDDTHLCGELRGWTCPTCLAWWDLRGLNGAWVTDPPVLDDQVDDDQATVARLRRMDRAVAAGIGAGAAGTAACAAGWVLRPHEGLVPNELIYALAGLLAAAGAVVLAVALLRRWLDQRRYAGNELLPVDGLDPGVRDVR